MQSLISPVDHESRHNSYNANDDVIEPTEDTPLLRVPVRNRRDIGTIIGVGALLLVLIVGVIIGIYLLVLQNDAEHILPPETESLELLKRSDWDSSKYMLRRSLFKAKKVFITHTNTAQCLDLSSCSVILSNMQMLSPQRYSPYNFYISTNGLVLEALGWGSPSPLHPDVPSLVLALIGNFTAVAPSLGQVRVTADFVSFAESQDHLDPYYEITIHNTTAYQHLYDSFKNIPHFHRLSGQP